MTGPTLKTSASPSSTAVGPDPEGSPAGAAELCSTAGVRLQRLGFSRSDVVRHAFRALRVQNSEPTSGFW